LISLFLCNFNLAKASFPLIVQPKSLHLKLKLWGKHKSIALLEALGFKL